MITTPPPHIGKRLRKDPARNERYTTPATDAWCRAKAGVEAWDLDVAACEARHLAQCWFGPGSLRGEDGLSGEWFGNVWCNPPWDDAKRWVRKAWSSIAVARHTRLKTIAMLLPANRTEQPWWQDMIEADRDLRGKHDHLRVHFLPGRTKYGEPGDVFGQVAKSPPFGSVLLVWRPVSHE